MKIKELKEGMLGVIEGVIVKIEEKTNKNDGTFLLITFSDGENMVSGKKWNTKASELNLTATQTAFFEVKAEMYKGNISYIIRDITESSSSPEQFICGAPIDSEKMYEFIYHTAGRCGVYAKVVQKILSDNKEKLMYWGAAHSMHHSIRGGLLYHTYRMVQNAAYIANTYNKVPGMVAGAKVVNTELLVAGTILHDIGKLWELESTKFGDSEYTSKGTLLGHLYIGAEIFGRYARAEKMKEADVLLMQHMILSHHGKQEYGAVVVPAITEAMILHEIDMIDSRIYQFEINANTVKSGEVTSKIHGLDQRVYRPSWRGPEDAN